MYTSTAGGGSVAVAEGVDGATPRPSVRGPDWAAPQAMTKGKSHPATRIAESLVEDRGIGTKDPREGPTGKIANGSQRL